MSGVKDYAVNKKKRCALATLDLRNTKTGRIALFGKKLKRRRPWKNFSGSCEARIPIAESKQINGGQTACENQKPAAAEDSKQSQHNGNHPREQEGSGK